MDKLIRINKRGSWEYLTIKDGGGEYTIHTQSNYKVEHVLKQLDLSSYEVYINNKFAWVTGQ